VALSSPALLGRAAARDGAFVVRRARLLAAPRAALRLDSEPKRAQAKQRLLDAIARYDAAKVASPTDGVPVDFGVSGGELDAETGKPVNLLSKLSKVSDELGVAACEVVAAVEALEPFNPTADPTRFFGTAEGALCPLHGAWKLQFTTAADASFSSNSTRGAARTQQFVDAVKSTIVNQIDFLGESAALQQLRIVINAKATSPRAVALDFRYGVAHVRRLFGLPVRVKLFLPLFALFAIAKFVRAVLQLLRRQPKAPPAAPAQFEVVYLDDELRCHRTGEGNLFVQLRPAAAALRGLADA